MESPRSTVEVLGVSKRFGGTQALDTVSVEILTGEVHAFVGQNGAGKSTLGKIIGGIYVADSGELRIKGRTVKRWDTLHAQRAGIAVVAQELSLVPQLTVEENVFLGIEESVFGFSKRNLTKRMTEIERDTAFAINPKAVVENLRIADLQKVEIMRALARKADVIIFDEPTSSLTAHETSKLHEIIRQLKDQGKSIIYVSHFLDAVLEVSDRVTIMRDGRVVRTSDTTSETKTSIVTAMLGREQSTSFPERVPKPDDDVPYLLEVEALSGNSGIHDVAFGVRPGEIVGLLGLVGAGRSEIARLLVGADEKSGGSVTFKSEVARWKNPRGAMKRGMVMIPEDRRRQGLVLMRSVRENVALAHSELFSHLGVQRKHQEGVKVTELVSKLDMRPVRIELPVESYSGGNQQKVLLAKWLCGDPDFVIFDEPTRGVDIGAKFTIYESIIDLAKRGVGVLLISSEHEEILALCHRAYLVSRGTIIGEIDPEVTSLQSVLHRLFSVEESTKESAA
jgi:simple sugar transport system ATP-binding protein/ribose transport system ATP-binding protein